MKKIMILLIGLLSLSGCSSTDTGKLELTPQNKAEVVSNVEYANRVELVLEKGAEVSRLEKYEEFKESDVSRYLYDGLIERYKTFATGLSNFKTNDSNINELHNEVISKMSECYDLYTQQKDLYYQMEKLNDELNDKQGKFSDEELKKYDKLDEIYDQNEIIEEMLETKQEEITYTFNEISALVGVDLLK